MVGYYDHFDEESQYFIGDPQIIIGDPNKFIGDPRLSLRPDFIWSPMFLIKTLQNLFEAQDFVLRPIDFLLENPRIFESSLDFHWRPQNFYWRPQDCQDFQWGSPMIIGVYKQEVGTKNEK